MAFRTMVMKGWKIILLGSLAAISSCTDIYELDKYRHPEWLAGKLYTQLGEIGSLSTFKRCIEITGYDTIIDRTGSFTLFAPNNEAFNFWLSEHPEFNGSVENIPLDQLRRLVRYHIIQDAWTLQQIQRLDVDGWIDMNDPNNNKPRAYKRQTLLREPDIKYWIYNNRGNITIVDSVQANGYRMVYSRSRKYVPLFYPDYFGLYGLTGSDYEFYFDRPYQDGSIHYASAKVISNEVFAENGFIYEVDRVVDQIENIEQILTDSDEKDNYSYLRDLIKLFPQFTADMDETNRQPEAQAGLNFDTLYILNYPELPFNIHEELTGPNIGDDRYTQRYHNGLLAPDDAAFENFINTYISGSGRWNKWESVPIEIKRIILNNHMTATPVYQSDLQKGFYSGEGDLVVIDESVIERKYYASNATFLGLNQVVVPRALTSVSGPVYLRQGYSTFLYAMEYSKVLPAIKKAGEDYSFFILNDNTLNQDSSLFLIWTDRDRNLYEFKVYDRKMEKEQKMGRKILSKRLLNQVGVSTPDGTANKEFIENLAGNYIVYNHTDNTVKGGVNSTAGYNGGDIITVTAEKLEDDTDNGTTYRVNGWLLPPNYTMYTALSTRTWFLSLLEKAGMYNSVSYSFNFLTEGENYTVFVPSQQALNEYGADTLQAEELAQLLKYHFIKGNRIFTDGKKPAGNYSTLRIDESSTPLFTKYSSMMVEPGADEIKIYGQSGILLGTIEESEEHTNIMISTDTDNQSSSTFDNITTSVLHEIDFVIHK